MNQTSLMQNRVLLFRLCINMNSKNMIIKGEALSLVEQISKATGIDEAAIVRWSLELLATLSSKGAGVFSRVILEGIDLRAPEREVIACPNLERISKALVARKNIEPKA